MEPVTTSITASVVATVPMRRQYNMLWQLLIIRRTLHLLVIGLVVKKKCVTFASERTLE